jgi:hypothetical protein
MYLAICHARCFGSCVDWPAQPLKRISPLDMFCTLETQTSISHPTKLFPNQAVRRKVWITVSLLLSYNTPIPLLFRLDLNHHGADHGGKSRNWLPHCFLTNWTRSHGLAVRRDEFTGTNRRAIQRALRRPDASWTSWNSRKHRRQPQHLARSLVYSRSQYQ